MMPYKAIYKYSEGGFEYLNENLRNSYGSYRDKFYEELINELKILQNYTGLVFRGGKLYNIEKYKLAYANHEAITEVTFVSTTIERHIAVNFIHNDKDKIKSLFCLRYSVKQVN